MSSMKKLLKYLVKRIDCLNHLVYYKGVGSKARLGTLISNFLVNFFFRQNAEYSLMTNYKTTVVSGHKLVLAGRQQGTLSSLVNSAGCYLQAGNGITIGNGTIWAANVVIVSANHDPCKDDKSWIVDGPVIIGEDCWIGANVSILPGVHLCDRTVVGAGSVVTKSFDQTNIVIAGNPAKIVKNLKKEN